VSGQTTPAGWYPDPEQPGQQRYWDGTAWTENRQPVAAGGPPQAPTGFSPPPSYQSVGYGYTQGGAEPATFWYRFGAYLLDVLIIGIPTSIIQAIAVSISTGLGVVAYIVGFAAGVYYYGYFEGGETGQTIGKRTCNIRVVDATTYQPGIGMGRAIGRYFSRILSSLPCFLGYFWMLWDKDQQTWHDKIVTTRVTKV
jgi:uncharacterized RDD family membrane protein YckC